MKRWLLCGAFCLMAAVLPSLGMLQLEGAAASLPEGFFYANPDGTISQPVAEEELDHPLITGSVREGEQIKFLQFSSQVTTIEEAEEIVLSLLGPGAGELVLSTGDLAVMFRQLKAVFWLALIPCLLAIAYGLTVRVIPPWWQRSSLKTKVADTSWRGSPCKSQTLFCPQSISSTCRSMSPKSVGPWRALAWVSRRGGTSLRGSDWN